MAWERNACNVFVWKYEGKRPLGKCRHRWRDDIKMDLKWKGLNGIEWIHVAWDRDYRQVIVNMVVKFWVL
jgi:hypothetical protein